MSSAVRVTTKTAAAVVTAIRRASQFGCDYNRSLAAAAAAGGEWRTDDNFVIKRQPTHRLS